MNNDLIKKYPLLIFSHPGDHDLIQGLVIDNDSMYFDYSIEIKNGYSFNDYELKRINTVFNEELIFNGYALVHKLISHLFTESYKDNKNTRDIIYNISKNIKQINDFNLDQYALINSTASNYKNRFVYLVKSDEQYFIFIKKSIDNNAEILETIIFESEKETIEYIKKLEVQWLH
jgi:hypothetical protein